MKPGRNDPCPCGSGRKYKHCCERAAAAATDRPEIQTWRRVRRAIEGMPGTLHRFSLEMLGSDAQLMAWEDFVQGSYEEGTAFDPHSPHLQLFLPWFYHCWTLEDEEGPTESLTSLFLQAPGLRLDPLYREYLQACLEAPFGFHEILRCEPGTGFDTREVLSGAEHRVFERSASQAMQAGDILYGQIVDVAGIALLEACAPSPIPAIRKLDLIDLRRDLERELNLSGPDLLSAAADPLRLLYFDMIDAVLHPRMPQLTNTDGDPLELQQLTYEVSSAQDAFDALHSLTFDTTPEELLATATRTEDGSLRAVAFEWAKAGNRKHAQWSNTILGHIAIDGERLTVQINSAKRARAFQRIMKKALGARARLKATEIQSADKMLEEARSARLSGGARQADAEQAALMADPQVREQMQAMMSAHFESWVDTRLPILGNRTPLQAVKTPHGKEKVAVLVREAERGARRMDPPVDEAVLARVRQRLGLPAP
ncbi:MAG TPA: SEC-C metal-binding domain-containing protein [Steroidobacteraceae bacterium]|nr:SEC-C metal-binding domain-containing protein [Steroidobacteraceae bacterium]